MATWWNAGWFWNLVDKSPDVRSRTAQSDKFQGLVLLAFYFLPRQWSSLYLGTWASLGLIRSAAAD